MVQMDFLPLLARFFLFLACYFWNSTFLPPDRIPRALDEASTKGSTVVSVKNDWVTIFPPDK
jgi:hypothetical protein